MKDGLVLIEPKARKALLKLLDITPDVTYAPHLDYDQNIKAIFYSGADYKGRKTRVFAYYGVPEDATAEKPVPAVVLVHGGGGQAYYQWVQEWLKRGYAAIAIDTYGNAPVTRESAFSRDEQGAAPKDLSFSDIDLPLDQQWMYHAVAETILANSVLRLDKRINPELIGLSGISWGGVIATITLGVDHRFSFGIPVYGCGYLYDNHTYFDFYRKNPKVREYWGGEYYIPYYNAAVLWLNGDKDGSFDLKAFSRSAAACKNAIMSIIPSMPHGHNEAWEPQIIYDFAKMIVNKQEPQLAILKQPSPEMKNRASFPVRLSKNAMVKKIDVYYRTEPISYLADENGNLGRFSGEWERIDGEYNDGIISVELPENAMLYYINISTVREDVEFVTSTFLVEIE